MRRAPLTLALVVALAGALGGMSRSGVGPAGATGVTAGATTTGPAISLLEQPAWSPLGADVGFRLDVVGATPGLEVRAVVHAYVQSRIAFERTLDGERLGSQIGTSSAMVDALPVAPTGGRLFTLPLQDPDAPRDPNRVRLSLPRTVSAGVYPVEIELRDPENGEVRAGFVTHLVATAPVADGPPVAERLRLSWIWRIAANPATRVDGSASPAFLRAVAPGGRLATIADLLTSSQDIPLVLSPGPETVGAWQLHADDDPAVAADIDAVRVAAQSDQVLAGAYVPIDGPSLQASGLGDASVHELRVGTATLDATLDTRVDPRTSDAAPLDGPFLEQLRLTGVDRLVVAPSALVPLEDAAQFTPARPFALESQGQLFTAVETRPELTALLETSGSPALRAQHLLAGLAVVALEQPNHARGVVMDTALRWDPDPAVIEPVIVGLRAHPLVAAVSLDDLIAAVTPEETEDGPVVRRLAPILPAATSVHPAGYLATSRRLDGLASMVGATDPVVEQGRELLLASLTSAWSGTTGRSRAAARLATVDADIDTIASQVIAPAARTVTVTSRRAEIPVSILNATGREVRVSVRLDSEKLEFPEGNERVLTLAPQNTTVSFVVESRASGTFPLAVSVASEDGALELQRARYTVRSTVVSGVGVFLTIGAGLFLAVWWLTHWRRTRRNRMPVAPVPT